jgi:hypothetical protein
VKSLRIEKPKRDGLTPEKPHEPKNSTHIFLDGIISNPEIRNIKPKSPDKTKQSRSTCEPKRRK